MRAFRTSSRDDINVVRAKGHRVSRRIVLRVSACLFAAVFAALPALAQDRPLYVNRDHRFGVIFPGQPMERDIVYTTRAGDSVPAREFFIDRKSVV